MIDDFLLVEKRLKAADSFHETFGETACERIIKDVRKIYENVGLPRHAGKAVEGELRGTFWGIDFDGEAGIIHPSLKRSVPVAFIVLEMLRLGYTSVALLEVLAGSFVSIFQCRRRCMSVLELVYKEQSGKSRSTILKLSRELREELLRCVGLTVLACIDMRLEPSTMLVASDASPSATAAVCTDVTRAASMEFQRHSLQKGLWNKLLSPCKAYLKEKGLLGDDEELPDDGAYDMHPLWEELVLSKTFRNLGPVKKRQGRRHINMGEVTAALDTEVE